MEKKFLIRIYGDSLSLPRVSEGVYYPDSYPELLAKRIKELHPGMTVHLYNRSLGGATILQIENLYREDSFFFGQNGGDIMVLQCGIVDCAPRPIPDKVRSAISKAPEFVKKPIIRLLHGWRRRILNTGFFWRRTEKMLFTESMVKILQMASPEFNRVYVINIAPTTPENEWHSPGFMDSINAYNLLIKDVIKKIKLSNVFLIDAYEEIRSLPQGYKGIISTLDGHHITSDGHRLYASNILNMESSANKI